MSKYEEIRQQLSTLSIDDIELVNMYCNEKLNAIRTRKLEEKIIKMLKEKYPRLGKLTNGFKLSKHWCEPLHEGCEIDYGFEICICGTNKNCKSNNCKHLKIYASGTFDNESALELESEYSIATEEEDKKRESLVMEFGTYDTYLE